MSKIINDKNLFKHIISEDNIYKAYKKSRQGPSKYKNEAMKFAAEETYNLKELRNSLMDGTYEFSEYVEFKVHEPKVRIINAPKYSDKIVQLSLNNVLKEIYNKTFIHDSYACIDGKGTHKCVERISYFMRKAKWEYGESAYIIKMDIKKFFYSIDRPILKDLYFKKIKCNETLDLIYKIIDSADAIDAKGLPLGNTLSQISANIYMNEVDQHAKRDLSLKYYVRYADDTIIIVKNKKEAIRILEHLKDFTSSQLNLRYNEKKTKIFPINQGVNAIGCKIYATHRLLRDSSKRKIKRKASKFPNLLSQQKIEVEKVEQILNSWLGHAKNASSYNFILSLIKKNNYIYLDEKDVLKVNRKVIE